MNQFGAGKDDEAARRRQLDSMLADLNRRQLLEAALGRTPSPSAAATQNSMLRETELTLARLNAERALVQALYANNAATNLNITPAPAAPSLHLPLPPGVQGHERSLLSPTSFLGLTARGRYGPGRLNASNSIPYRGSPLGQVGAQDPVCVSFLGQESEGSASMVSCQSNTARLFEGGFNMSQDKKEIVKLSEKERKEAFPLPVKGKTSQNQADYTPPKILSLAGFEQKWKIVERQLQKKRAAGKISAETIVKMRREFFLRSIQKCDSSHLYRRISGIKARSDAYGRLSKRPRVARKEG